MSKVRYKDAASCQPERNMNQGMRIFRWNCGSQQSIITWVEFCLVKNGISLRISVRTDAEEITVMEASSRAGHHISARDIRDIAVETKKQHACHTVHHVQQQKAAWRGQVTKHMQAFHTACLSSTPKITFPARSTGQIHGS